MIAGTPTTVTVRADAQREVHAADLGPARDHRLTDAGALLGRQVRGAARLTLLALRLRRLTLTLVLLTLLRLIALRGLALGLALAFALTFGFRLTLGLALFALALRPLTRGLVLLAALSRSLTLLGLALVLALLRALVLARLRLPTPLAGLCARRRALLRRCGGALLTTSLRHVLGRRHGHSGQQRGCADQ